MRDRVLIAGIGGCSLGLELMKCLQVTGRYLIYGADSSAYANGHYMHEFADTIVVPVGERFAPAILRWCRDHDIAAVIPGGETPMTLLTAAAREFKEAKIALAGNTPEVVATCSDKAMLFRRLAELKIPAPSTLIVDSTYLARPLPRLYTPPWVVKPARATGGSRGVHLLASEREVEVVVRRMLADGQTVLIQDYIPMKSDAEYTIGVLSLPTVPHDPQTGPDDGLDDPVGEVVMRRLFHSKISVSAETGDGLISSGISQGFIGQFPDVARQASRIAVALGSRGPLNIQARMGPRGDLLPFEINPRFSSSTYLRCLAGYNEVDVYLQAVLHGIVTPQGPIRSGFYLRGLSEIAVRTEQCVEVAARTME